MDETLGTVFSVAMTVELICAAVFDARERRLPNGLALLLAITAALLCAVRDGFSRLLMHGVAAIVVVGALLAFEMVWRRVRHTVGQGMGDLKALFALCLVSPVRAITSYAVALLALALGCLVCKKSSLPLLPFLVPVFLLSLTIWV